MHGDEFWWGVMAILPALVIGKHLLITARVKAERWREGE